MLWTQSQTLPYFIHVFVNIVTVNEGCARSGREETSQQGHGRCFSGPVVPQERSDLILVEIQR